jgi:hypothetical protein
MKREMRPDVTLCEASQRVHYSMDMLLGAGRLLDAGTDDRWASNAYLECLTIHARALIHFVEPRGLRDDDIIAADFFGDESEWARNRPSWYFPVDYVRSRVGKEVAHLTYAPANRDNERQVGADRGDPIFYGAIRTSIAHAMEAFRRNVPAHRIVPRWFDFPALDEVLAR